MAYDFRQMTRENAKIMAETKIMIDEELFDPTREYKYRVKKILFENINGRVELEGYFTLPPNSVRIPNIVKIQKYLVKFDEQFMEKNSNKELFQSITLRIIFFNITDQMDIVNSRDFLSLIKNLGAKHSFTEERLTIVTNKLADVDMRPEMKMKYPGDENFDIQNRSGQGGFAININKEDSSYKPKKIIKNLQGANEVYHEEYEQMFYDDDNILINEINQNPEKTKFVQLDQINILNNFIDFESDSAYFDFTQENFKTMPNNLISDKFIDPYHINGNDKLKKFKKDFHNYSFKASFNHQGEIITRGAFNKNNFRYSIEVKKIIPNKILQIQVSNSQTKNELLEFYHSNTFVSYINTLNKKIEEKILLDNTSRNVDMINNSNIINGTGKKLESNEQINPSFNVEYLCVNDYSFILNDYVNKLILSREQIKTFNVNTQKESKKAIENLNEKLEKEISALKLFKNLFLNSYLNNNSKKETLQAEVESFREEVKRMRKRRLLDWLVESTEKEFEQISNKNDNDKAYNLILHCLLSGRLRKAVEISNTNGLFDLSMIISQSNMETKAKLIKESVINWERTNLYNFFPPALRKIYNLISINYPQNNIQNLKEILEQCDWRKVILYNSIFTHTPSFEISSVIQKFEEIKQISKSKNIFKQILPEIEITKSHPSYKINNLYYLLISLYSSFENNSMPINLNTTEILNKICYTANIFSDFTDHHVQYIIITILLNTLKESYNIMGLERRDYSQFLNLKLLKELHFKLLVKNVEELMILNTSSSHVWKHAISLIKYSNISNRMQKLMIDEIIYRNVDNASGDVDFFNPKIFNQKITKEACAYYQLSGFYIKEAYENFILVENFENANEIFIFYILCPKLIEDNVPNDITGKLEYLAKRSGSVHTWEKYGTLLFDYLNYVTRYEEKKINNKDITGIISLIKKVESLNKNTDFTHKMVITYCRDIMLSKLRAIYNTKCDNKEKGFHFCVTPNMAWIRDKNLTRELKLNEFNKALDSFIIQKSKTFSN